MTDTPVPCAACGYDHDWKTIDFHGRPVCGDEQECRERAAEKRGHLAGMREALRIGEGWYSGTRPPAVFDAIRAEIERREKP